MRPCRPKTSLKGSASWHSGASASPGRRGRSIRAQYFLGPRQAVMAQLTKLAVCFVVGRPVTQALVLRLALVLLFRTVTDALKDPAVAEALRADLEIARGAE